MGVWITAFRQGRRDALVLAVIGIASGVVTALVQPFDGLIYGTVRDMLTEPWSNAWEFVAVLGPGFLFGGLLGWWIHRTHQASVLRWLALTVAGIASWYLAVSGAIRVDEWIPAQSSQYALPGLAGGLIGAAVVLAAAALLYPFARQWKPGLAMLVLGTAFGAILHVEEIVLFPLWQAAVAACLGVALHAARTSER